MTRSKPLFLAPLPILILAAGAAAPPAVHPSVEAASRHVEWEAPETKGEAALPPGSPVFRWSAGTAVVLGRLELTDNEGPASIFPGGREERVDFWGAADVWSHLSGGTVTQNVRAGEEILETLRREMVVPVLAEGRIQEQGFPARRLRQLHFDVERATALSRADAEARARELLPDETTRRQFLLRLEALDFGPIRVMPYRETVSAANGKTFIRIANRVANGTAAPWLAPAPSVSVSSGSDRIPARPDDMWNRTMVAPVPAGQKKIVEWMFQIDGAPALAGAELEVSYAVGGTERRYRAPIPAVEAEPIATPR